MVTLSSLKRRLFTLAFLSLGIFALSANITAPSLIKIIPFYRINPGLAGLLFSLFNFGYLIGALEGGYLSDILGKNKVISLGLFFLFFGLTLSGLSMAYSLLLFAMFIMGIGGGFIGISSNAIVSEIYPLQRGFYLNLVNISYNLGALLGPILTGYILSIFLRWQFTYYIVAAISFLILLLIPQRIPSSLSIENRINKEKLLKLIKERTFLLLGMSILFYGGVEQGIAAWISFYLRKEVGLSIILASMGLSLYWGIMIPGRIICGCLSRRFSYKSIIFYLSLGAAIFSFAAMASKMPFFVFSSLTLTGLSLSGIPATILAYSNQKFPKYLGIINGLLIAYGGIGRMSFPWLVGALTKYIGLRFSIRSLSLLPLGIALIFYNLKKNKE